MADLKFKLDRRLPEEAALMDRLATLPEDRHPEFLRRLALRGFQHEYAELHMAGRDEARSVAGPTTPEVKPSSNRQPQGAEEQRAEPPDQSSNSRSSEEVSLTSLKVVVG